MIQNVETHIIIGITQIDENKKECELYEMVLSYSKESDKCTNEDVDTPFCIYQYLKSLVPMMIISHLCQND